MTFKLDSPTKTLQSFTELREHYYYGSSEYNHNFWAIPEGKIEILPRTVLQSGITPGYHVKLKKGELVPFTELHVVREYAENAHSLAQGKYRYGGDCITGSLLHTGSAQGSPIGGLSFCNAVNTDLQLQSFDPLLTKALGEANTGALLILLELAESPKTVRLVADAVFNFRKRRDKLLQLLRKKYKTRRTWTQTANIFADMWLEYRYGWRQLYYSSQDIATSIDVMSKEKHFVVNTGKAFSLQSADGTVSAGVDDSWINIQLLSKTATTELEQRAVVSLQVYKALAALDFNLVGLGYELIPFSFVLDWFVNVGDVARAIWPTPHVNRTAATSWKLTHKAVVSTRVDSFACDFGPLAGGLYTHTREEYKRSPYEQEIPVVLNYNPRLGLSKILDLISLVVGGYNRHDSNSWRNAINLRI